MNYKFARRSFLRSLGASTAVLPLLRNIEARAQGLPAPPRLLVMIKPVGVVRADFLPTGTPTPTGTTTFSFNTSSQGFEPLKSRCVYIDGINHVAETINLPSDPTRHGGDQTHEGGFVALMTGVPTLGKIGTQDHVAGGWSMDQMFYATSPKLGGPLTPMGMKRTLEPLSVGTDTRADRSEIAPRVMSYNKPTPGETDIAKARQPIFPEIRPLNVFNRIFGNTVLPMGTATDFAAIRAQKKSLLDYMRKDLTRLGGLVPSGQKVMIDAHAASIQSLETTINTSIAAAEAAGGGGAGGAGGGMKCSTITAPAMFPDNPDYWYDSRADKATYHPHEEVGRLHLKIIKAAFQCDLLRVATFMWSPGTNYVVFGGLTPGMQVGGHHVMSHGGGFGSGWLTQIDKWYADTTASALQEFATTPDIDGTSMLIDNTVSIFTSEVAQASHNWSNVPTIIIGGQKLGIKGGRFMKPSVSRPWNDIWLALMPAFGINGITRWGGSTQSTGPLPGLVG